MVSLVPKVEQRFGGDWTIEKLDAIERYCDGYTTALKSAPSADRPFRLHFIDAFAGTGYVDIKSGEQAGERVRGSALRALSVDNRPFDQVDLIELDRAKAENLGRLVADHQDRVRITIGDANEKVVDICRALGRGDRAIVLFDPTTTDLNWSTVEAVAKTGRCDVWILFPLGDVRRDLARTERPTKDSADGRRLTRVLGTDVWFDRYAISTGSEQAEQASLDIDLATPIPMGGEHWASPEGTDWILDLYRESVARIFPDELVLSRELTNSRNSPMFSLFFGCANSRGAEIANRIARGALKRAEKETKEAQKIRRQPSLFG